MRHGRGDPLSRRRFRLCRRSVFDVQHVGCLGSEAAELPVLGPVFLHPLDCLVVQVTGLRTLAKSPAGESQEECVETEFPPMTQPFRLLERGDRLAVLAAR